MDIQGLAKRIEWLDEERRKDKNVIAQLQDRIVALEGMLRAAEQDNKNLTSEVTHLKAMMGRLDMVDAALAENRVEFSKWAKQQKQQAEQREQELKQRMHAEIQRLEVTLAEAQKTLKLVPVLEETLGARQLEEQRLSDLISNLLQTVDELRLRIEDQSRSYRVIEDGRRQDTQRVTDLQGEVAALRKRSDEFRGHLDLVETEMRRLEARLKELTTLERELSENQISFINKQSEAEVEREKTWKTWAARFEVIESQASEIEAYLQDIQQTHLEVRRTQERTDDLAQKVERRINELIEMQRLSEERFRQEWNTFKADDQKRWMNYLLSHDEQQSDTNRRLERITENVTLLEDSLQALQDYLQEITEFSGKGLQALLEAVRGWAADHERLQSNLR